MPSSKGSHRSFTRTAKVGKRSFAKSKAEGYSTNATRGAKKKKKPPCELGVRCPYKDEYQHGLEFSHDDDASNGASARDDFRAFSGAGRTAASSSLASYRSNHHCRSTSGNAVRSAAAEAAVRRAVVAASAAQSRSLRPPSAADSPISRLSAGTDRNDPLRQLPGVRHPRRRPSPTGRSKPERNKKDDVIVLDDSDDDAGERNSRFRSPVTSDKTPAPIDLVSPEDGKWSSTGKRRTESASAIDLSDEALAPAAAGKIVDLCDDSDDEDGNGDGRRASRDRDRARATKRLREGASTTNSLSFGDYGTIQRNLDALATPLLTGPLGGHIPLERRQLEMAIAASNRDVMTAQDREYYESLRRDQEKDRAKLQKERETKEEEEMHRALEESSSIARKHDNERREREKQAHAERLEPEPAQGEEAATVAFRLPSRCDRTRLVRRFSPDATSDQLFAFLHGSDELENVATWTLREVLGGKEVEAKDNRTLRELGLIPRGMLIVRDES